MPRNIAAYTAATQPEDAAVAPCVSITREEDGQVSVTCRDGAGQQVEVRIPPAAWFQMARRIFYSRNLSDLQG